MAPIGRLLVACMLIGLPVNLVAPSYFSVFFAELCEEEAEKPLGEEFQLPQVRVTVRSRLGYTFIIKSQNDVSVLTRTARLNSAHLRHAPAPKLADARGAGVRLQC